MINILVFLAQEQHNDTSQICVFGKRKVVASQILLDGAERVGPGCLLQSAGGEAIAANSSKFENLNFVFNDFEGDEAQKCQGSDCLDSRYMALMRQVTMMKSSKLSRRCLPPYRRTTDDNTFRLGRMSTITTRKQEALLSQRGRLCDLHCMVVGNCFCHFVVRTSSNQSIASGAWPTVSYTQLRRR